MNTTQTIIKKRCSKPNIRLHYSLLSNQPLRLKKNQATEFDRDAIFVTNTWVFKNKETAHKIANKYSVCGRKVEVTKIYDPRLDTIWYGSSKTDADAAKRSISIEAQRFRQNKELQKIHNDFEKCGAAAHWLREDPDSKCLSELSDIQRRAYDYHKPEYDRLIGNINDTNLRENDLKLEIEVNQRATQNLPIENIMSGLGRNERGDADLFINLFRDKYRFDSAEGKNGEFYVWNGTEWTVDHQKQRLKDMEEVAQSYEQAANQLNGEDTEAKKSKELLRKRSFNLRTAKRCHAVFVFVSTDVHIQGKWDHCPGKLPCLNGIVDLKTGELQSHKPENLIRSVCPTRYNPEAKRRQFDQFLRDITLGKHELESFLKRVLGSALLGMPKEERIFIFYGENGRNGKGTLMQTLENVLGPIARTFSSEMILQQRYPSSSSAARPDKANLRGTRIAIISEINEGRKIDAAELKNLSGGDTISCRSLYSNVDQQLKPTHTLIIQTNYKPKANAKDNALWQRNILIPFNAQFVDEPDPKKDHQRKKDTSLKEKLLEEREGILAWLIEGALEYQKNGLDIPQEIKDITESYRHENDGIQMFLDERCKLDPTFSTPCQKMQTAIKEYCQSNGFNVPNEREISSRLRELFGDPIKTKQCTRYKGVSISNDDDSGGESEQ